MSKLHSEEFHIAALRTLKRELIKEVILISDIMNGYRQGYNVIIYCIPHTSLLSLSYIYGEHQECGIYIYEQTLDNCYQDNFFASVCNSVTDVTENTLDSQCNCSCS